MEITKVLLLTGFLTHSDKLFLMHVLVYKSPHFQGEFSMTFDRNSCFSIPFIILTHTFILIIF